MICGKYMCFPLYYFLAQPFPDTQMLPYFPYWVTILLSINFQGKFELSTKCYNDCVQTSTFCTF